MRAKGKSISHKGEIVSTLKRIVIFLKKVCRVIVGINRNIKGQVLAF